MAAMRRRTAIQGSRPADQHSEGVRQALEILGCGLLAEPANDRLRAALRDGRLSAEEYFRQLLWLVYRLLVFSVVEDARRGRPDHANPGTQVRSARPWSMVRLCRLAERKCRRPHQNLYRAWQRIWAGRHPGDCSGQALPLPGGLLWSPAVIGALADCRLANACLLRAIRAFDGTTTEDALRAEDLGGIYELLLRWRPRVDVDTAAFTLSAAAGQTRKATGSYYTPPNLVRCLLDVTLDPVLERACQQPEPARALLALKICDPACGSGHFLVAAARRLAERLALVRADTVAPIPEQRRAALRDVLTHCIYGVDSAPLAVELCKVVLWLEAAEPGQVLATLDQHIRCGNSLLGATPALLAQGIPDEAFVPASGGDRNYWRELQKQNRKERRSYRELHSAKTAEDGQGPFAEANDGRKVTRLLADTWCAAFVWNRNRAARCATVLTESVFRRLQQDPQKVDPELRQEIESLAERYQFFHWHLAFPEVFHPPAAGEPADNEQTGWCGGFDVIIGNPPYGAEQDRAEWNLLRFKRIHGKETANSAADFIELAAALVQRDGRVGLVLPKSLTFSHDWRKVRTALLPHVLAVLDVGRAWQHVLLEQVVLVFAAWTEPALPESARFGKLEEEEPRWTERLDLPCLQKLGILPTSLTAADAHLLRHMLQRGEGRLGAFCSTRRGSGVQAQVTSTGTIPVLAGKDLRSFRVPRPEQYLSSTPQLQERLRFTAPPQAVFQNIVAHITRPAPHIKLIGTVVEESYACLDTVNLLSADPDVISPWTLAGLLMSDLLNWYVHVCIYNRAIRTMHFDDCFLSKIPVPPAHKLARLEPYARCVEENPDAAASWLELNRSVFDLYGIPPDLRVYVSSLHKPRWM